MVETLVQFDGLDWYKKVRFKIALEPDSRNPYLYGALFPDELHTIQTWIGQVRFPSGG